jgi:hypothetical protein
LLPLFTTSVIDTSGKFVAGVVDTGGNTSETGGKMAASVFDTGGKFDSGYVDTGGAP